MTTLLIDLGNTALKWTPIEEPDNPHTIIHKGSTHFKEELYDLWLNMRPKRIIGCTVAAPVVAFSLTKFFNDHGIRWNWVRTQPSFHGRMTLNNCYENPGQLGADRWYAAVGAADAMLEERRSLLVVHTGTATTVDSILYRESGVYDFMGGRITLGPTLMKTFLTKGIPSLTDLDGAYDALPRSTRDAVMTGIIDAQVGLIPLLRDSRLKDSGGRTHEIFCRHASAGSDGCCGLSGLDRPSPAPRGHSVGRGQDRSGGQLRLCLSRACEARKSEGRGACRA